MGKPSSNYYEGLRNTLKRKDYICKLSSILRLISVDDIFSKSTKKEIF
jgi:hypothetical protein